jgi:uncharacterized protein YyaL (SSP411 family)
MLYDNATLLGVSSDAFAVSGNSVLRGAANGTADWLLAEMRDPDGGFYSTLDADSDGAEGKFYTFTREDFAATLGGQELAAATGYFGLEQPPNFEDRAWHLQPRSRVAPFDAPPALVAAARRALLSVRNARVAPGRDDKILTSWNGLLAANLAKAARRLGRPDLGEAAQRALDFIRARLWKDGRLRASYKDGRARFAGYLDDYALTLFGLVESMQWRFRPEDLEFATGLADSLLTHFADPEGGFFFTADDHEPLIHRPKPLADESLPSGNGVAALMLDTLGHLLGETRYLEAAAAAVRAALPGIARYPEAHATLLAAIDRMLEPPEIIVVRAAPTQLDEWRMRIDKGFEPQRLAFFIPDNAGSLPGLLGARKPVGSGVAYLCRGTTCEAPLTDLDAVVAKLERGGP